MQFPMVAVLAVAAMVVALLGVTPVSARLAPNYGQDTNYGDFQASAKHFKEKLIKVGYKPPADTPHDQDVFMFFSLHDYDIDGYLDGHELRLAFQGYEWDHGSETVENKNLPLEDIESMIDHALEEDDRNGDGLISWDEYLESVAYHHKLDKQDVKK